MIGWTDGCSLWMDVGVDGWMDVVCPLSHDPWLVFENPQAADSGALIMGRGPEESTTTNRVRVRMNSMTEVDEFFCLGS